MPPPLRTATSAPGALPLGSGRPRPLAASTGQRPRRAVASPTANSTPTQRKAASLSRHQAANLKRPRRGATTIAALIELELADSSFRSARFFEDFVYAANGTTAHANNILEQLCASSACSGLSYGTLPGLTAAYNCAPPDFAESAFPAWFCKLAQSIAALTAPVAAASRASRPRTINAGGATTTFTNPTWVVTGHRAPTGANNDVRRPDFALLASSRSLRTDFDWRHILIVGEHQSRGSSIKAAFVQLACYAEQIFIAQPFRRAVVGILTYREGPRFEVWRFDRAGALGSHMISYATGAGLRTLVLTLDATITSAVETFASRMQTTGIYASGFQTTGISWEKGGVPIDEESKVSAQVGPEHTVFYKELVFCGKGMVSRGTRVWKGYTWDIKEELVVHVAIKEYWRSIGRRSEAELYHLAAERGVQGLPALIHHASYENIQNGVRKNHIPMQMTSAPELKEPLEVVEAARQEYASTYDTHMAAHNRVFTRLVLKHIGVSLDTSDLTPLAIARALLAAAIGHASLFFQGDILHRDLSPYNILASDIPSPTPISDSTMQPFLGLYGVQKNLYGCLIDLDYALDMRDPGASSGAKNRTGTYPFIAINVLRGCDSHRYRHDLESLLYVLLYVALYPRPQPPPARCHVTWNPADPLERWFTADVEDVATNKRLNIVSTSEDFEALLTLFRDGFAPFRAAAERMRLALWRTTLDVEVCELFGQRNQVGNEVRRRKLKPGQVRRWLRADEVRVGVPNWDAYLEVLQALERLVDDCVRQERGEFTLSEGEESESEPETSGSGSGQDSVIEDKE